MENTSPKYFLAANSCMGFVSHFEDNYSPLDGWRCYIIKGGPGTGKSSFMRYTASVAMQRGERVELCPCSSDPHSLDGVILPGRRIIILDGTAPHVVEPTCPGVCEEIINLGHFWDGEKLRAHAAEIITVSEKNAQLHKTAARYLAAAGQLFGDNLKLARGFTDEYKAENFACRLADKYIPKTHGAKGTQVIRFISGITPLGVVSYTKTVTENFKNVIVLEDKYGAAANAMMSVISDKATDRGYDVITLLNPFMPSEIIDHVLIPGLSLAFVTENEYTHFGIDGRMIHARRFSDVAAVHRARGRMVFNRRVARELLISAAETLSAAKSVHDELESYYINAMDFKSASLFAQGFTEKLFK